MKLFYSSIILSILLASCHTSNSVTSNHFLQKRKYTRGWHFNNQQRAVSTNTESYKENTEASLNSTINLEKANSNLIEHTSVGQAECDTILLNDGKIVRVIIISKSDSTIQYTKCESDDPVEYTMNKREVKALQCANGKFEFIQHQSTKEVHEIELESKEEKSQARNGTVMTKKELKEMNEKLSPISTIVALIILAILCLPAAYFLAILSWGGGPLAVLAICVLILSFCLLTVAIVLGIKRNKEKKELLKQMNASETNKSS